MIVKMNKVTVLVSSKHRDSALEKLRQLGVLHIKNINNPVSENIQSIESKLENVEKTLQIVGESENQKLLSDVENIQSEIDLILQHQHNKENLQRELTEQKDIHRWFEKWGAVSYNSIQQLKNAGIYVRFYIADKNFLKNLPEEKIFHVAKEEQNVVYLTLFSESPEDKLDLREDAIPPVELVELEEKISHLNDKINLLEDAIKSFTSIRNGILKYQTDLKSRLQLNLVKYGMGEAEEIAYLSGFCPVDLVPEIKKQAEIDGWGYMIETPDDPGEVPTLTRNPKWVRIINPLFEFMGTLPGYHEQDVSFVFLVFFSIFYAMIVGDAGYGLIFLTATYFMSRKQKDGAKDFFHLMYLMSFTTILWGLITGTWFGAEKISQLPFLKPFIIDKIYSFNPDSSAFIMQLTFVIGVVQLSIGHFMTAFRKMNSLTAIAEIGWVLVLGAVYFIANNIVLGKEMASVTMPLLISGVVLILFFANFQKNIIKGILLTLGNLPLDIISSFSDIVSYIRLFAVGLATVIVATNFNTMAIGTGIDSILSGIIAAVVLLLGHSINLALCGMSILVHGVRLNMLEFSGHVGVQWTGKPYEPFKE
jgi:V/A-type H+/Na+-transporting ATPase subunit I